MVDLEIVAPPVRASLSALANVVTNELGHGQGSYFFRMQRVRSREGVRVLLFRRERPLGSMRVRAQVAEWREELHGCGSHAYHTGERKRGEMRQHWSGLLLRDPPLCQPEHRVERDTPDREIRSLHV